MYYRMADDASVPAAGLQAINAGPITMRSLLSPSG